MSNTKHDTEKQKQYQDKWIELGLSTEPANRVEAEEGIRQCYRDHGFEEPRIIWANGLKEGMYLAYCAQRDLDPTTVDRDKEWQKIKVMLNSVIYGQHDADDLFYYDFHDQELGADFAKIHRGMIKVGANAGWWWAFEGVAVVCERHNLLHFDDQGRLHCEDGPAVAYPDGTELFAWHGVPIDEPRIVTEPGFLTPKMIDDEKNSELRRVMLEIYGAANYARDSGLEVVQQDQYGNLLRKDFEDGTSVQVVRVVNSTPEPDGTLKGTEVLEQFVKPAWWQDGYEFLYFKDYHIRCKSTRRTAHEAVAASFGKTVEEYQPNAES